MERYRLSGVVGQEIVDGTVGAKPLPIRSGPSVVPAGVPARVQAFSLLSPTSFIAVASLKSLSKNRRGLKNTFQKSIMRTKLMKNIFHHAKKNLNWFTLKSSID